MAGKSRSLSGIWVPVQLDTSKIEAQLSKLRDNFTSSISGIQSDFDGALNTKKFADQLVNIPKQIGYIRDAVNGLKTAETAFDKPIEGLKEIASAAGITETKLKELYSQMATNQAVTQQVNALTQLQKSLGLTAQEAIRYAQANTQISGSAVSAFADKNQIAGMQQFSTQLQKLAPQAKLSAQSFDTLNKEFTEFQAKQASFQYISGLAKNLGLNNAALKKYRTELNITEKELSDFIAQQKAASTASRGVLGIFSPASISSAATSGLAAFGASLGAYGLADLTKSSFQASLALENVQVAFNSIFRDANKAEASLGSVSLVANQLGIDFLTAAEGAKKMFASAQGTVLENEVTDIFKSISEAGVALRLDEQRMASVFLAVSQSIGKGKIAAEELRSQLAEALPGAVQIFADSMGITTVELDKMLEQGQVGIENLIGFADELSKRYSQGAADASTSLQAELGRLSTSWTELKASFSDTDFAAEAVRQLMGINNLLKEFQPQITFTAKALLALGASLAAAFALTKLKAVWAFAAGLGSAIKQVFAFAIATKSMTGAIGVLASAAGPLALVTAGVMGIAYAALELGKSKTPIIDSSNALSQFSKEAEEAGASLEKLADQNLKNYFKSLSISLTESKSSLSEIKAELDSALQATEKGFKSDFFGSIKFDTADLYKGGDSIVGRAQALANTFSESTLGQGSEALTKAFENNIKAFEDSFSNIKTIEDLEKLRKATQDTGTSILLDMQKMGASAENLVTLDKGLQELLSTYSKISQTELDLKNAEATIKNLGKEVDINTKDIENSLKGLIEFGEDSDLADALSLDVGYEGAIRNVKYLQTELSKFKDLGEDLKSQSFMRVYEEGLASLYSRASQSPSEMASLNRALDEIGKQSEESKRWVDALRQSLQNLSGQDISIKIQALEDEGISNYLENKLPKQVKNVSGIIQSALSLSGVDLGTDSALADFDKLGKNLAGGASFESAIQGLSTFNGLTAETNQLIQEGLDTSRRYYVETTKSASTSTSKAKEQSEALKATKDLQETILSFEEQIRDSEYETFKVLEQKRQQTLQTIIDEGKGSAQEIANLQKKKEEYMGLYAQVEALNLLEQQKEDAGIRASFYEELGSRIGDTNMQMIALSNTLATQREEWNGLIPENLILQMEELQKLDISTDFFDGMKRGFNELKNEAKDFASTAQEYVTSAASSMADAFTEFATGGARDFRSLMQSIFESLLQTAVQALSNQFVSQLFGLIGGFFGGGTSKSTVGFPSDVVVTALTQHSGGQNSGFVSSVPAMAFAGAPKFHNGGGLFRADEYPAILQYGERVLNRAETKAYNQGGQSNTIVTQPVINIQNYSSEKVESNVSTDNQGNMRADIMIGQTATTRQTTPGTNEYRTLRNAGVMKPKALLR